MEFLGKHLIQKVPKMDRKESKLSDYCRWNEPNEVVKFRY